MIRSIEELKDLSGMRVLLRADLNVPVTGGTVTDPFRIDAALRSMQFLLGHGARLVIASHMSDKLGSLAPVFAYLKTKIPLSFTDDVTGPEAHAAVGALRDGQALLLQNIRRNKGEESNDPQFVRELASLADVYVNDAFPVSHRAHASIVGVPALLPSYAGFQFLAEVEGLSPALAPQSPSLAILGGAKLVTKIALLKSLLSKYDHVFVGGALANDFYAARGYETGKSLVSGTAAAADMLFDPKIILPDTVVVSNPAGKDEKPAAGVGKSDSIADIAVSSFDVLLPHIAAARSIVWNGPMGHFETGFREGTDALARLIAHSDAKAVVGGGDTLSSIQDLGLLDKFAFVSTAGGAMLDFLANGTLPGIKALEQTVVSG